LAHFYSDSGKTLIVPVLAAAGEITIVISTAALLAHVPEMSRLKPRKSAMLCQLWNYLRNVQPAR
jgi:hypothetical protein